MFQMDIEYDSQTEFFAFQNTNKIYYDNSEWNPLSFAPEIGSLATTHLPSTLYLPVQNYKQEQQIPAFVSKADKQTVQLSEESSFSTGIESLSVLNSNPLPSANVKIYSKDSLKFCRRITKLLMKHFNALNSPSAGSSSFLKAFLGTSAKVINSILAAYGTPSIQQIQSEGLIKIQLGLLQQVWQQFKSCLSYNKNKKICIVKPEFWNILFCRKTFSSYIMESCKKLEKSTFQQLLGDYEGILKCFCDILYSINQLIILAVILRDDSPKGGQFIRKIETVDNLLVSMMDPRLFEFYNHRSGKFASECCGRCKICRSKNIPEEFGMVLENTRKKCNLLMDEILVICPTGLEGKINEDELMYLLALLVQP